MDLLKNVLQMICDQVNSYLSDIDPRPDDWVTLTTMVDQDDSPNKSTKNKIVMSVYNLTPEAVSKNYSALQPDRCGAASSERFMVTAPPLYINVHLIFIANFAEHRYPEGLAALSRLISFFQQQPIITPQNSPALAPEIDKLTFDLESLSLTDVSQVMHMLGTRYMPSAFYKLRVIPFAPSALPEHVHPIASSEIVAGSA